MGRFSRIGFSPRYIFHNTQPHRHLTSPILDISLNHGTKRGAIFTLLREISGSIFLCDNNADICGRPASTSFTSVQWIKRHFHATGSRYTIERNFYEILGVSKHATRDEIRKAFHALAKKYHPDANKNNPSAKRKFQEIRDAYETLSDSRKRAEYDRGYYRGADEEGNAAEASSYSATGFRTVNQDHFSDNFHKIFSEIFESEHEIQASDIQVDLLLSFFESANGCTKHLSFHARVLCDTCKGRGYPTDAKCKICPTCRGVGRVTVAPFTSTCITCKGLGRIIKDSCMACRGSGTVEGVKEVDVTIPAGIDSGDTIRVPKAGNGGGPGVHPGNLNITVKVAKDPVYDRDGADIYVDAHISFTQAILGGDIEVPSLFGKMRVKIPNGVQPGQILILRGRGLPKKVGFFGHGDQYIRFRINIPLSIKESQRTLLEEFAKEEMVQEHGTPAEGNWWQEIIGWVMENRFELGIVFAVLIFLLI